MATPNYSPIVHALVDVGRLPALGPGSPNRAVEFPLTSLTVERAFAPQKVKDFSAAQACLAGLWLLHDFIDEAHAICQDLDTAEGSYWHGILHRREPDFSNAKYWFRRVGRHPIFEPLRAAAADLTRAAGAAKETAFLLEQQSWDPMAFIDLCEKASRGQADEMLSRRIQRREWDLLFEYCCQRAIA